MAPSNSAMTTTTSSNNSNHSQSGGGGNSSSHILPGQEEPLKKLAKILNGLLARSDSGPFREPVDWRGLELWDYPEVIKNMMDLGTVQRKLDRHVYHTAAECAADIRLVWSNCMTYNAEGSDFWLLAKALSKRFEDRYRKIKQEHDVREDLLPSPSSWAAGGGRTSLGSAKSRDSARKKDRARNQDREDDEDDDDNDGKNKNSTNNSSTNQDEDGEEGVSEEDREAGGEDYEEDEDEEEEDDEKEFHDTESADAATTGHSSHSGREGRRSNVSARLSGEMSSSSAAPTLDARARFAANLLLLNGMELGWVVSRIEQRCPAAVEVRSEALILPEKMEILLDKIDGELFLKLSQYAADRAANRKHGHHHLKGGGGAGQASGTPSSSANHHHTSSNQSAVAVDGEAAIDDISNKRRRKR